MMLVGEGGRIKMAQALRLTSLIICIRIYNHITKAPKPSQPLEVAGILPSVEDRLSLWQRNTERICNYLFWRCFRAAWDLLLHVRCGIKY